MLKNVTVLDKFPNKKFSSNVVSNVEVAEGVNVITFKVNDEFPFLAWQYVWVEIPQMTVPDPKGSRRAFSILSTINKENTISILARISESGYKQSLFGLKPGDEAIIHGPFGNSFVIKPDHQPKNVVMIAGGVGIAAFLPMIQTIKNEKFFTKAKLCYINNEPKSTPFLKDLDAMKKNGDFFDFYVKYGHFSWGDLETHFGQIDQENCEWWVAGPQGMVNQVFEELIAHQIPRRSMVFENFYPSAKNNLTEDVIKKQISEGNYFVRALQSTTNHSIITDAEGKILFVNHAAEVTTGYTKDEILGNTPRLWGGMMGPEFYVDLWEKKSSGQNFDGEIVNRRKNGELYQTMAHISPILDNDGSVVGYIGTEEDITEAKRQKEELQKLAMIVENSADAILSKDLSGNILSWNHGAELMYGYTAAEMVGQNIRKILPDDKKGEIDEILAKVGRGEKVEIFETKRQCKDGTIVDVELTVSPIKDEHGNIYGAGAIARNISELKKERENTERMNKLMVGRELKMAELKREIQELKGGSQNGK